MLQGKTGGRLPLSPPSIARHLLLAIYPLSKVSSKDYLLISRPLRNPRVSVQVVSNHNPGFSMQNPACLRVPSNFQLPANPALASSMNGKSVTFQYGKISLGKFY
jgi:hypothetical protein